MTENSAIFNARHGGGSFHPHRQPAPTAQDCLKRGTGANGERPGSYLVNVGSNAIAAARLSIIRRSLSCRFSPEAEKFAAPERNHRPSIW